MKICIVSDSHDRAEPLAVAVDKAQEAGGLYSQLMIVAYGGNLKKAGLDGHVIQPEKLQQIANRKK